MNGEPVHPAGPHAGNASSIDPRMSGGGRRFVQRQKRRQDPPDKEPPEAPPAPQAPKDDSHDSHVDVLA